MDLKQYLESLRNSWVSILVLFIVGVSGGALGTLLTPPVYRATTSLFVSIQVGADASTNDLLQGSSFAQQKVRSYILAIDSPSVLQPVIDEMGLDGTVDQLSDRIEATSPANTVVIEIDALAADPQSAAVLADEVAASFIDMVERLEAPSSDAQSVVRLEPFAAATPPTSPDAPNLTLNLVLGGVLGVLGGVVFALARSHFDTRIRGLRDIEQLTEAPVLGVVANDPDARRRPLIVHVDPRNPRAEAFRALRTSLQFVQLDSPARSFVITSSLPGEGKSTTTANLAIALAETGARVAIVDGDLRLPRIADYLQIEGAVGLTDVLIGRATLADALQQWGSSGDLWVLPAGQVPPNPSELLGSQSMQRVLAALEGQFDAVVIDAPPLLPVTDAAVLSKLARGTLVVASAERAKKHELKAALSVLDRVGTNVVGLVFTMAPTKGASAYGYAAYGQYYGATER